MLRNFNIKLISLFKNYLRRRSKAGVAKIIVARSQKKTYWGFAQSTPGGPGSWTQPGMRRPTILCIVKLKGHLARLARRGRQRAEQYYKAEMSLKEWEQTATTITATRYRWEVQERATGDRQWATATPPSWDPPLTIHAVESSSPTLSG